MAARKRISKKSSAASFRSRREAARLASLVFFVDRSLGKRVVARALRDAGARVEVHDDHFPQDATDVEWLTHAGAQDWIILSKDERIRRNPLERNAFQQAGVRTLATLPCNVTSTAKQPSTAGRLITSSRWPKVAVTS